MPFCLTLYRRRKHRPISVTWPAEIHWNGIPVSKCDLALAPCWLGRLANFPKQTQGGVPILDRHPSWVSIRVPSINHGSGKSPLGWTASFYKQMVLPFQDSRIFPITETPLHDFTTLFFGLSRLVRKGRRKEIRKSLTETASLQASPGQYLTQVVVWDNWRAGYDITVTDVWYSWMGIRVRRG